MTNSTIGLTKIQIQAAAALHLRARNGDTSVLPYLQGFTSYQNDPVKFCAEQLKVTFTDDIQKVANSVLKHKVTIAMSANGVGKSHSAAHIAVWFYKAFPESRVYTTAAPPEKNLKQILWSEIGSITHRVPAVFASDTITADMNIVKNDDVKSFITGVVVPASGDAAEREAKFAGKHAPFILFIVDEGDGVPLEVYRGIDSGMSGGFARLLIMFNPRADRGYVAGLVRKKQGNVLSLSAFSHPNVITGKDLFPGAVTREITVERINKWTEPLTRDEKPDISCFTVPKFLVGSTAVDEAGNKYPPLPKGSRRVRDSQFFYKVLGKYPPQAENQLISRLWIEEANSRWLSWVAAYGENPPTNMIPTLALDVADMGDDSNMLAQKWGNYIPRLRGWRGIDPDATAIKAAEIVKGLGVHRIEEIKVFVDGLGVGAGVAPRMTRLKIPKAIGIKVSEKPTKKSSNEKDAAEFYILRDQLAWSLMLWLKNDKGAMLPPDDEIAEELTSIVYWTDERTGRLRITSRETIIELIGRSPDKLSALMLLFAPEEGQLTWENAEKLGKTKVSKKAWS
jgi:hypothetical protein